MALVFLSFSAFSQINTYSPYSRFGIGQLNKTGLGQNSAMGTAGIALRTNEQINYLNPAAYAAIDTNSFIFDFGVSGGTTKYKSDLYNTKLDNFNIQHLAIGFPITRWWKAAAGVTPFSSVGYNIFEEKTLYGSEQVDYFYKGTGGLTKFFIGTSVTLFQRLSLGMNMSTLFGYIQNQQQAQFIDRNASSVTQFNLRDDISGIVFDLGAQYTETLADKYFITLGAIYNNETKLKDTQAYTVMNDFPGSLGTVTDSVSTTTGAGNDTTILANITIDPNLSLINEVNKGSVIYPQNFGLGLAFGIKNKLTITGDYYSQRWSRSRILGRNDSLVNLTSYKFGAEYIPNETAMKGYLNHIRYRAGAYYANSYVRIRNEQLNDYGITFGVGLPFKNTKTTFNLGVVLGQRGTLNNNLIKENYGIVNFSLVLHDFWFFKRKFD